MLAAGTGNRAHALSVRGDDLYETPEVATRSLLAVQDLPRVLWEPACGRGAIGRVLQAAGHHVIATDLVDYGYGRGGRDFLFERRAPEGAGAIVTNPPFKLAAAFVRHALGLVPDVHMLLRLAFLEGLRWTEDEPGPALQDHLVSVRVFVPRLPMMHRDGWEGRTANSGMAFAWFHWSAARVVAPARIEWLQWRRLTK